MPLDAFASLTTPHVADACMRLGLPVRIAPAGIRPVAPHQRVAGPAVPVRHYGSVDAFIEAIHDAPAGGVLVVDNEGRTDEGCVGDLTALEAKAAGLGGIVIFGLHRDTAELRVMDYPLFSYGTLAAGPRRLDSGPQPPDIDFGGVPVSRDDVVFGDEDGVLFVAAADVEPVLHTAATIAAREREQAAAVARGTSLYEQLRFAEYVARRADDPSFTFRRHLREIGGAVEE
jgi:regulator of RNase E activity RraA